MDTRDTLRSTVAEFLKVDPGSLGPASTLAGRRLQGSIGRAALDAALRRRLGVSCPAVYSASTYGELEAAVLGTPPPPPQAAANGRPTPARPQPTPPPPAMTDAAGLVCGVDLELVESLPDAADPWEHEFYKATFTPAEIAYCSLQPDPRTHFAARWCAKEALKKCDNAFLGTPMADLELARDDEGPATLRAAVGGAWKTLPYAVSVSHTPAAAVALVVRLAPPGPPAAGVPPPPAPAPPRQRGGLAAGLALAIASVALAVSVYKLLIP